MQNDIPNPEQRRLIQSLGMLAQDQPVTEQLEKAAATVLTAERLQEVNASLIFSHSITEKVSRLFLTNILNRLPYGLYKQAVGTIKRFRKSSHNYRVGFSAGPYMQLIAELRDQFSIPAPAFSFCLTHDLDTTDCAAFAPEVANMEEAAGLRAAYNVLTAGPYTLERNWLDDLERRGFEIGLHGDTHDMSIGFLPQEKVRQRLQRCLDALDRQVAGYRAPALGVSKDLLDTIAGLGFCYDSSVLANVYNAPLNSLCYPYLYPGTSIWEFPLTLQDSQLFADQSLSDSAAFGVVQEIAAIYRDNGGVFVLNTHPIHLRNHGEFYRLVLEWLASEQITVKLVKDCLR